MQKLAETLRIVLDHYHLTPTELSRLTGIGQPVIHRMVTGETDNPKVGTLSPIANYFNISISQLVGDVPLPTSCLSNDRKRQGFYWRQVPTLAWEQALHWPENVAQSDIQDLVATDLDISEHAYSLVVKDTTMRPRFPERTLLIIDPDRTPQDRDFAIIHIEGQKQAIFKQVLIDGDDVYLKPLNSEFKMMHLDKPFRYLGTVMQARNDLVD